MSLLRHNSSYIKTCICVYICLFQVLLEISAYWIAWATCMAGEMNKESYFYGGDPANNHLQTLCYSSLFILNIWKAQLYLTAGTVNSTVSQTCLHFSSIWRDGCYNRPFPLPLGLKKNISSDHISLPSSPSSIYDMVFPLKIYSSHSLVI